MGYYPASVALTALSRACSEWASTVWQDLISAVREKSSFDRNREPTGYGWCSGSGLWSELWSYLTAQSLYFRLWSYRNVFVATYKTSQPPHRCAFSMDGKNRFIFIDTCVSAFIFLPRGINGLDFFGFPVSSESALWLPPRTFLSQIKKQPVEATHSSSPCLGTATGKIPGVRVCCWQAAILPDLSQLAVVLQEILTFYDIKANQDLFWFHSGFLSHCFGWLVGWFWLYG